MKRGRKPSPNGTGRVTMQLIVSRSERSKLHKAARLAGREFGPWARELLMDAAGR